MYQQALASITFLSGPEQGRICTLQTTSVTIGRNPASDIHVTDPSVSGNHAQIECKNGIWTIKPLKTPIIVEVNMQQVSQPTVIQSRDTVRIGRDTRFSFLVSSQPYSPVPSPLPSPATQTQRAPQPGTLVEPSIEVNTSTATITLQNRHIHTLSVKQKRVLSIGRDPSNDIVINEPVVSGFHAQLSYENNQWVLIHPHPRQPNNRTTNGLLYEGRQIAGDEQFRKPLVHGAIFRIGNKFGTLVTLTYSDGSGASQDVVPTLQPIALRAAELTFGRATTNTITLNHPQVSAFHARLVQERQTYRIVDLHSTNHVYVNGQAVTNKLLNVGDEIRIGPFKFTYDSNVLTQQDESKSIRIDALHLNKVVNNQTVLLNDISFSIPPRKFVALVGGSGYGKSTLMDALNGLRPAHGGKVFYNGQDYYTSAAAFSTQLGYVPQDDIIHRDLSVERALFYAAKLRLPSDFTNAQIQQRINEVLDDVEMQHRRTTLVNKLSGGQRKRVSIALELLAKPSIFFLDEPTSGLDPGLDRKMMLLLRRLADKGHTIVLVTHATNNINVCDYVCFLCKGGRLAYFGPPDEATKYFGQPDFADIYSALEPTEQDPTIPEKAEVRFKTSPEYQKYIVTQLQKRPLLPTTQTHTGNAVAQRGKFGQQFFLLSQRYLELLRNDVVNLWILLLQAPFIATILVLIIKYVLPKDVFNIPTVASGANPLAIADQMVNAEKTLFIMAFAAVLFGCINAAREIVKEAPIYRRERAVNLGIMPYMLSKFAILGVLCMVQCAVLVLAVNAVSPFRDHILLPASWEIYITLTLTSLAALMLGLAVSAISPNNDRAASFIPIILLPQVIFSGVIFKTDGFMALLADLFASRWAIIGMGSTINLDNDMVKADAFAFQHTSSHLWLTWFVLVLMIVAFGGVTAYFLKHKDVRRN